MKAHMSPVDAGWISKPGEPVGPDLAAQEEARHFQHHLDREGTFAFDPTFFLWSKTETEEAAIDALLVSLGVFIESPANLFLVGTADRAGCVWHDDPFVSPIAAYQALDARRTARPHLTSWIEDADDPENTRIGDEIEELLYNVQY